MTKVSLDIWGRAFELEIVYDVYQDEEVLKEQVIAYERFIANAPHLLEEAECEVKKYCMRVNKEDILENEISNIFKYVKPKALYIKRNSGVDRIVALLCDYRFNPDDGIAIVFKNEAYFAIGTQNIIL